MQKLDVKALALSIGAAWGVYMLFLGWIAPTGWGLGWINGLSSLYIGFKPGFIGGIVGACWGFFDGFVGGALIAYFYNRLTQKK